jgi:Tol biopolymer transport system component
VSINGLSAHGDQVVDHSTGDIRWSPTGELTYVDFVFGVGARMHTMDVGTHAVTTSRVRPGGMTPGQVWSSDGSAMAFMSKEQGKIYVVDGASGEARTPFYTHQGYPRWLPGTLTLPAQ